MARSSVVHVFDKRTSAVEVALAAALALPRPRVHVVAPPEDAPAVLEVDDGCLHVALPAPTTAPATTTPDPSLEGVEDADALALARLAASGHLWAQVADVASCVTGEQVVPEPEVSDPSDAVVLEAIAAAERLVSGAAALQARLVAALDARWCASAAALAARDPDAERHGHAQPFTDAHVGARLHLTPAQASTLVWRSEQLAGPRSRVLAALEAGAVSSHQAQVLVDRLAALPDAVAAEVEDRVLESAGHVQTRALGRRVERAAAEVDPAGADQRAEARRADRCLSTWPEPDATAVLQLRGPADGVETVRAAIDARARAMRHWAGAGEVRTLDQWRFDAAVEIARDVLEGAHGPVARTAASRPVAHITLPASVVMGLSDLPGYLRGHGPVPAEVARRIAADATWRRLFTDPVTGVAVATEERRYRPSALLAELVHARHPTCTVPGCDRPAWRCELDHRREWPQGPTSGANLGPRCRHHHLARHSPLGFRLVRQEPPDDDGTEVWRSPTGHTYRAHPEALDVPVPDAGAPPGAPPGAPQ